MLGCVKYRNCTSEAIPCYHRVTELYQPPYSPDFPHETAFSFEILKYALNGHVKSCNCLQFTTKTTQK